MFSLIVAISVSSLWSSLVVFEKANWQGQLALALTQLPSLIVAATPYPKVDGFLKSLFQFLNIFSFLAHKDSAAQTLKMPLTQSRPPLVIGTPILQQTAKGFARLNLLLGMAPAVAALWILGSCKSGPQTVPQQLLSCAEQGLPSATISLVEDVLSSASPNWAVDMETLGAQYGLPVVECIVGELIGDWNAAQDGGTQAAALSPTVLARGQAWLAAHGAAFK